MQEQAAVFIAKATTPFKKLKRSPSDGPLNLGKSLNLSQDFYSFTYLHQFKRKVIFDDDKDSDHESEDEKKDNDPNKWARRKKGKTVNLDKKDVDSDEEEVDAFYEQYQSLRSQAEGKLIFLIICQLMLLLYLGKETFTN